MWWGKFTLALTFSLAHKCLWNVSTWVLIHDHWEGLGWLHLHQGIPACCIAAEMVLVGELTALGDVKGMLWNGEWMMGGVAQLRPYCMHTGGHKCLTAVWETNTTNSRQVYLFNLKLLKFRFNFITILYSVNCLLCALHWLHSYSSSCVFGCWLHYKTMLAGGHCKDWQEMCLQSKVYCLL